MINRSEEAQNTPLSPMPPPSTLCRHREATKCENAVSAEPGRNQVQPEASPTETVLRQPKRENKLPERLIEQS